MRVPGGGAAGVRRRRRHGRGSTERGPPAIAGRPIARSLTGVDLAGALAYLDDHLNLETDASARAAAKRLDRVQSLVELMGDPHRSYPVLHLTGTNGKGSTARILTSLLVTKGLAIGTYT